jgi:chemotaxis regulatin CheY-phosphate phosphatase CheZ
MNPQYATHVLTGVICVHVLVCSWQVMMQYAVVLNHARQLCHAARQLSAAQQTKSACTNAIWRVLVAAVAHRKTV